jgi:hypothetical protein
LPEKILRSLRLSCKVQKTRKNYDKRDDPNRTDEGSSVIVHHCKVAAIRENLVTVEGVHDTRTNLKGILDEEESCEAGESPQEGGCRVSDPHGHDQIFPSERSIGGIYCSEEDCLKDSAAR